MKRNLIFFEFDMFRGSKYMIIGRNSDINLNAKVKENNSTHWCHNKKLKGSPQV